MARKIDKIDKLCVICGDKAKGINFNALTCMSCKAFFRRNAKRNKEMKCPFQDACMVNTITRKFCSKCRLKKCFTVGMKKEWILSDEEKRVIKEKIIQNRLRRQEQEMVQQQQSATTPTYSPSKHTPSHPQHRQRHKPTLDPGRPSRARTLYYSHNAHTTTPTSGAKRRSATPKASYFNASGQEETNYYESQSNELFSNVNPLFYPLKNSHLDNVFTDPASYSLDVLLKTECNELRTDYSPPTSASSPTSSDSMSFFANDESMACGNNDFVGESLNLKKDVFLYSSQVDDNLEFENNLDPCFDEDFSFPESLDLFDGDIDNIASFSASDTSGEANLIDDFVPVKSEENFDNLEIASSSLLEENNNNIVKDKNDFTQYLLHDTDPFTFQELGFETKQSAPNSMIVYNAVRSERFKLDSIASCLNTAEDGQDMSDYDPLVGSIPRISSDASLYRDVRFSKRELIQPERFLVKELTDACTVLQNPYKRIIFINSVMNHQCQVIEFYVHRLIRMAKRLSAFNQLSITSQTELLKKNLLKMLSIRSVINYDKDREAWFFLDDKCKVTIVVNIEIIKSSCTTCSFQRHKRFPMSFMNEWKTDSVIFDLLTAIVLFTPEPGMCDRNKIQEENLRYTYLLRRYLEIKYPTILEAKSYFVRLMKNLDEMRELNADIVRHFIQTSKFHSSPLFKEILAQYENASPHHNGPSNANGDSNADSNVNTDADRHEFMTHLIGSAAQTSSMAMNNQQCGMSANYDYGGGGGGGAVFSASLFTGANHDMLAMSDATTMLLSSNAHTNPLPSSPFPMSTSHNYNNCNTSNENLLNSVN